MADMREARSTYDPATQMRYAQHPDYRARRALAENPTLTRRAESILALDTETRVLSALTARTGLAPDVVTTVIDSVLAQPDLVDLGWWRFIAKRCVAQRDVRGDDLIRLATAAAATVPAHPDPRAVLGLQPAAISLAYRIRRDADLTLTPQQRATLLTTLARVPEPEITRILAAVVPVDTAVAEFRAAESTDRAWWAGILADRTATPGHGIPTDVLLDLLASPDPDHRVSRRLTGGHYWEPNRPDQDLPDEVLRAAATHPDKWTRVNVAQRRALDPDTLRILAIDPDVAVREQIAHRSDLPDDVRERLVTGKSRKVAEIILRHQAPDWGYTHPDPAVRAGYARYGPVRSDVYAVLAGDPDPVVRRTLIRFGLTRVPRNRDWAVDVLTALAADDDPKVRALVAEHPGTPDTVLTALVDDADVKVRNAVGRRILAATR